jgi:hypothetical protein
MNGRWALFRRNSGRARKPSRLLIELLGPTWVLGVGFSFQSTSSVDPAGTCLGVQLSRKYLLYDPWKDMLIPKIHFLNTSMISPI